MRFKVINKDYFPEVGDIVFTNYKSHAAQYGFLYHGPHPTEDGVGISFSWWDESLKAWTKPTWAACWSTDPEEELTIERENKEILGPPVPDSLSLAIDIFG